MQLPNPPLKLFKHYIRELVFVFLQLLYLILLIYPLNSNAQELFRKIYGSPQEDVGSAVRQTNDGGYIITGFTRSDSIGDSDLYLIKTDNKGNILWDKTFGGTDNGKAYRVEELSDGGFVFCGFKTVTGNKMDGVIIKVDALGNKLWENTYATSLDDVFYGLTVASDGNIVATGLKGNNHYLVKYALNGSIIWEKDIPYHANPHYIQELPNQEYLIIGLAMGLVVGDRDYLIMKTNSVGDIIFRKQYDLHPAPNTYTYDYAYSGIVTPNGDIIACGTNASTNDMVLIKTDANGDSLWQKTYNYVTANSMLLTTDSNMIITGGNSPFSADPCIFLLKMDLEGTILWEKKYRGFKDMVGNFVEQTLDGGFAIVGFKRDLTTGSSNDIYFLKTDSLGNLLTNVISGNVFDDLNSNCIKDSTETVLSKNGTQDWIITIEPGQWNYDVSYVTPDSTGNYMIELDTGLYTVGIDATNDLWMLTCPDSSNQYLVSFEQPYDSSLENNFGFIVKSYCSLLEVNITSPFSRRCFENKSLVHYCNNGTLDADSVVIEIHFNDSIIPISSSIPWDTTQFPYYKFNIGNLKIDDCGSFEIITKIACNASLGSIQCVQAKIFPQNECNSPDSIWDKSSIAVEGYCLVDSIVYFTIYNTAEFLTGDMDSTSEYRIYENNILVYTERFKLNGGDSLIFEFPGWGNTYRVEADQRPGHPGKSQPRATVEACGTNSEGEKIYGLQLEVPEDDVDDDIEIFCFEITGSFDPNDKSVKPSGVGDANIISSFDQLEYLIRFQNTGNDTAFKIVIRDSLSEYLDISSLQRGASSHNSSFKMYGNGILEWTFDDIYLPDSNINEAESHGFVKYKINQIQSNSNGTMITNKADIYFDYNAPVTTNETSVMVYDTSINGKTSNPIMTCNAEFNVNLDTLSTITSDLVQFNDSSIGAQKWVWDFGDGNSDSLQNPSHMYLIPGVYDIQLIIKNELCADTAYSQIVVDCPIPIASFNQNMDSLDLTLSNEVVFTNTSDNVERWFWDFGDGNSDTTRHPIHVYSDTGTFEICLIVINICSDTAKYCRKIEVILSDTSGITNIFEYPLSILNVNIYPNPHTGEFVIEIQSHQNQNINLYLFNTKGQLIFKEKLPSNTEHYKNSIELDNYSKGIYYYQVITDNEVIIKKVVYK